MKALIQAGGLGTRLHSISGDLPKPMVKIGDKPILEWQLLSLKRSGVNDITIVINKNGDAIPSYFGNGDKLGLKISYIKEDFALGTAGALYYIKEGFKEDFFIIFGDLLLDVDWRRFLNFHQRNKGILTTFVHPNSHPFDSDLIITNKDGVVCAIDSKNNHRDYYYHNLTNAGIYVASKDIFSLIDTLEKRDFEKDILLKLIDSQKVYAYKSSEYVKDCGTPDRFYSATKDIKNGVVKDKCLLNKQKAIFLDRDGVINKFGNFVTNANLFELIPEASEAIKKINNSSYLAIVITNQPIIARGDTTFMELNNIHNKMETLLGNYGAYLDDIYFCPHHPDKGYAGEIKELKIDCDCRKPKIGLLLKAQEKYNIDFSNSYFIGDTYRDIQTAANAKCKSILVTSGDKKIDKYVSSAKPNYIKKDILEAVNFIFKQ